MYRHFFKRFFDFLLSLCAILVLSPILIILMVLGLLFMRGNPFFVQKRVGMNDKVFSMLKFRTMDNRKDGAGVLLPDEVRLNKYGRFLRSTSLDELPELFNILIGDMSIIGPRPLLVRYLPYYTDRERKRHSVRPGLTGLAQVKGRNDVSWSERFKWDINYIENITFLNDIRIIIDTIKIVLKREGTSVADLEAFDVCRMRENSRNEKDR